MPIMRVNIISGLELVGGLRQARLSLSENLKACGVKILRNSFSPDFDVMNVITMGPRALPFILKYKSRKPIVMHAHILYGDWANTFNFTDKLEVFMNAYIKNFYGMADALITPTDFSKKKLIELGLSDKPIHVISNGVDTRKFKCVKARRDSFRRRLGIPENRTVIYGLGRLSIRKGVTTFANMARRFPDCEFVWAGPVYPRIFAGQREMVAVQDNAPENLHFLGYVEDTLDAHSGSDIFLFPSHYENEGLAVLEAASCGRPLVLRDLGAYRRFRNGKECFKCTSDRDFERALEKLIGSRKLRRSMGDLARTEVQKSDIRTTSRTVLSVYEGLVGRPPV